MKTGNIDVKKFLPLFMRNDEFNNALAEALNEVFNDIDTSKLRTWDKLELLNHEELDDLAWELNVLWYNKAGTLEAKREQIRTSDEVWRSLGTKYAIETVVSQLFVNGKVLEFWDAGLEPHHFSVEVYDPQALTPAGEKEFRRILEIVKRKSQVLDNIKLILTPNFWAYTGVVVYDVTTERHNFTG